MAKARKASVTRSSLAFLLYGEQFTGKSTMALQFAYFKRPDGKPFRVLYLDAEAGSVDDYLGDLEADGINLENIYIVYTQSLGEVRQYLTKIKNNEDFYALDDEGNETEEVVLDADGNPFRADAIVVDGTSILNLTTKQGLIEFSKKRNRVKADIDGLIGDAKLVKVEGAGLELKDYQTINFKGQDLILDLGALGIHYAVTAREADEKNTVKTPDGKTMSIETGRKVPEGFKGLAYNVKTEIRMFKNEDDIICADVKKDRTNIHPGEIVENPSLLDWQAVIDKTSNKKSFVISNALTKAVDIEQDIYSKEIEGKLGSPKTDTKTVQKDKIVSAVNSNIDVLKKEIISKIKALSAVRQNKARQLLKEAGLPIALKNIADVSVLEKILKVIKDNFDNEEIFDDDTETNKNE